jgi:hypothetical protein
MWFKIICKKSVQKINIKGGVGGTQFSVVSEQWSVTARGFGAYSCFDCAPGEGNYLQNAGVEGE